MTPARGAALARRTPQTRGCRRGFQVSCGAIASRHLSHRWLKACGGRRSVPCYPLIRIIKLSQPAAHKWGIWPAPPSCRDSLQIACDWPPDCAMIMLSLDAVIMMACNCWCALAAAQHPPISPSTCFCISIHQFLRFRFFLQLFSGALRIVVKISLSWPPRDSTRAPDKTEFAHVQRLPTTCGLLSVQTKCVLAAAASDVQTHLSNMHACMRRASSRHWILIFMNGIESPAARQQKAPVLAPGSRMFGW